MVDHIRVSENVLFLVIVIMTQFEQISQTQVNRWTAVTVFINVCMTSTVLFYFFFKIRSVNNDASTQQFRRDTQHVHSQYTQSCPQRALVANAKHITHTHTHICWMEKLYATMIFT